ncbi:MAG TPA: flagellar hook basal-body protein [Longimicrobiaceae bacterium]|nr:flagellar hook basal-body protein [Longimicrobiaceae bacterium]
MAEINGLIRAAHALHYWERRQEIAANNLANADTTGFKAERVFARIMGDQIPVADTVTDLTPGALTATGDPLDLAIGDEGFFVVQTAEGERLSRGGSFGIDPEGRIIDSRGNPLLGEEGEIVLPPGSVDIDRAGVLRVEGQEVARLRVETVPPGTQLTHVEGTLFLPDPARAEQPADERNIRQGHLEASNVNTIGSLVDLISIQRNYAAVQKAVVTIDEIRGRISDLGRPT